MASASADRARARRWRIVSGVAPQTSAASLGVSPSKATSSRTSRCCGGGAANQWGVFAKLSLLVGFVPLGVAVLYVVRPLEGTLTYMRPVSLAAIFAGVCSLVIGVIVILQGLSAPADPEWRRVYRGMSEALVPAFVNFGLLSASWLLVAVGMWRRTP